LPLVEVGGAIVELLDVAAVHGPVTAHDQLAGVRRLFCLVLAGAVVRSYSAAQLVVWLYPPRHWAGGTAVAEQKQQLSTVVEVSA
jgi:hypothetical protein